MPGDHLDLTTPGPAQADPTSTTRDVGRYLGIHFACCDAYARIYPNPQRTAYVGHCPRCARRVEFPIAPGGTASRFFIVQ